MNQLPPFYDPAECFIMQWIANGIGSAIVCRSTLQKRSVGIVVIESEEVPT